MVGSRKDRMSMRAASAPRAREGDRRRLRPLLVLTLVTVALGVSLLMTANAVAWDSPIPTYNSHYQAAEKAIRDLLADPNVSAEVKGPIGQFKGVLLSGSENEACHKNNAVNPLPGPWEWWEVTTGTNAGTTHPERWWKSAVAFYRDWQKTGNPTSRTRAYEVLGMLLHAIEDQGAAPHAVDKEHGFPSLSQFEVLSTLLTFNSGYYLKPDDFNHPGKSVIDGYSFPMSFWHDDAAEFQWSLKPGTYSYRDLGSVNMQMPAPTRMCFDVAIVEPLTPDKVYLRFVYEVIPGSPCPAGVSVLAGSNGRWHVKEFGPFSPRVLPWKRFTLSDAFAPNGTMNIDWRRAEDGLFYVTSTGQLQVFVTNTRSIDAEMPRPAVRHPWEYYDWLRAWTAWSIASPYWRGYNALTNDSSPHDFTIVPDLAPNTERALISMQWASTAKVAQWFLEDAQAKLNDPAYTVDDADGQGYRVVFYEDVKYNPTDQEYRYAQTVAAEPYAGTGPYFVPAGHRHPQGSHGPEELAGGAAVGGRRRLAGARGHEEPDDVARLRSHQERHARDVLDRGRPRQGATLRSAELQGRLDRHHQQHGRPQRHRLE